MGVIAEVILCTYYDVVYKSFLGETSNSYKIMDCLILRLCFYSLYRIITPGKAGDVCIKPGLATISYAYNACKSMLMF